jgi:dGTPase
LAHDLGHTPFGHGGETVLKEIYSHDFSHKEQSLRVVDILENNGQGLNLTYEVRDGILKHSKGYGKIIPDDPDEQAYTAEGNIVRIADIMAYLNHDLDDSIRSGVVNQDQVPDSCIKILGRTHSERANTMIKDLLFSTNVRDGELCLQMSDEIYGTMTELREFLYENVYRSPQVHQEFVKAKKILSELYTCCLGNKKMLQRELKAMEMETCNHLNQPNERIVCDFIASITDRYALDLYSKIFFPSPQY